jgi:tRNA nucleotidyltransferase (CCA-adding enzyme)
MHGVMPTQSAPTAADGSEVLQALSTQPGGPALLTLSRDRDDLALVGGAVRDLLLGRSPRELDVVVAGDAPALADQLATLLGAGTTAHERFGTAVVEWEDGRIDVAAQRAETYEAPGALPQVRPGSAEADLHRRDFTVNAIAVTLGGARRAELSSAEHALEDLSAGRLRVLHEQSFRDDPTRLLRLGRYRARLGFEVEEHTAELAAQALAAGALATVSRARIGAELRLALGEADALGALEALSELGVLHAIASPPASSPEGNGAATLQLDAALARSALALLPEDGRPDLLLMASLLLALMKDRNVDPELVMFELLDGLEFSAGERDRIMRSALVAPALGSEMAEAAKPSELRDALFAHTLEAVALGAALSDKGPDGVSGEAADWFQRLRHVHLAITGDDLLAAGIPSGPELGRRLDAALARKLDGELDDGRDAELNAALEARL